MIYYCSKSNLYIFNFCNKEYFLFNSIKRNWSIHHKCSPDDYISLGGNTLVLSSNDELAVDYLKLGIKLLLNN